MEGEERERDARKKKFYPMRRQRTFSISSNRVLVSPWSFLLPVCRSYQLRFVLCLRDLPYPPPSPFRPLIWFTQEHSTLLRPNFPSFDISFSPLLFNSLPHFFFSSTRKVRFDIIINVHQFIDRDRDA